VTFEAVEFADNTAYFASLRQRKIKRARENVQLTPDYWDRDCRCCMTGHNMDLFRKRQIKGAGIEVIVVMGEEIHAWHTDEEIDRFIQAEEARR
jgi:hypothetical protein